MSQWTHVSGQVRVDGLMAPTMYDLQRLIGRPSTRVITANDYLSDDYDGGDGTVPGGSEGTLQYEIITAGSGLVLYTVAIWGDLRDFGELHVGQYIQPWFANICKSVLVREAHLLVRVEFGPVVLLWWNDAKQEVETLVLADGADRK